MKKFHFLTGMPESGSEILAALLNQHPDVDVVADPGLTKSLMESLRIWARSSQEAQNLKTLIDQRYQSLTKSVTISRDFVEDCSACVEPLSAILGEMPKIVVSVRATEDCVATLVRDANPKDLDDFCLDSETVSSVKDAYVSLFNGYQQHPECFLFVDYDDLIEDPVGQLNKIQDFLGLADFDHYDFGAIKSMIQNDLSAAQILKHRYRDFVQARFWRGEAKSSLPKTKLDLQLEAGLCGDFELGWKLAQEIEKESPWDNRAAFNRGWYLMSQGRLRDGESMLFRGRLEKVFGSDPPNTGCDIWDRTSTGTILLNLEGGLGDQIHGVRYAKYLARRGCKVIAACSPMLGRLFDGVEGVSAVVDHRVAAGVLHDFWVPSMSAALMLDLEYADVDGSAYILRPPTDPHQGLRIGLRWQGNPRFEHEQHRLFPPNLLFDAVKDIDAEFISLQRDQGAEHRPYWVKETPLENWQQTQQAIAGCDLIITSCTSVAHLAAAMGVPTWIVVPILPYYLWALPGNSTPWYHSVRLFRQEKFGDWQAPFDHIKKELKAYKI